MVTTTRVPNYTCPHCGNMNDAATCATGDAAPTAGDISCCEGCMEVSMFNDDLTMRSLTADEFMDLPMYLRREVLNLRAAKAAYDAKYKKEPTNDNVPKG